MSEIAFNKQSTALLICDFYAGMMDRLPHAVDRKCIDKTLEVQRAARQAGILVCYSATVFRKGYPEINERNMIFSQRKRPDQPDCPDPLALIHPALGPRSGEVIVGKHRISALFGTDLEMILRANNIDTLILLGFATSGVVLSTMRYAADSDYRLFIVEDCCADRDPAIHDFLCKNIFPRQAHVIPSAAVINALEAKPAGSEE